MPELLEFTRITGYLVKTMAASSAADHRRDRRHLCRCRCHDGAGLRHALWHPATKTAFLEFTRVGLAGRSWAPARSPPRVIGQGRASELLFTGRAMSAQEGLSFRGFFNAVTTVPHLVSKRRLGW